MKRPFLSSALVLAAACTTAAPVGPLMKLDRETARQCERHCQTLGMRLGAVVVIRDSTGCVCEPLGGAPAAPRASAGVLGGAVAQLMDEGERREQQRREQERRRRDEEQRREQEQRQRDAIRAR